MDPDGMLKGWKRKVRNTRAISSASMTTLMVSHTPPCLAFSLALRSATLMAPS